ncbi:MAG: hemolysin family protein [Synergistaceae bacterium]
MSSDLSGSILLLAVLLFLSGYFSATETSITAMGKSKFMALLDEFPGRKKELSWLMDNISKAVNVTLIGNNLVNIASSAVATTLAISFFGTMGPVYAVAVMTLLIVVFCEILPKNFAIVKKESILLKVLPSLYLLSIIISPITGLLNLIINGIGKLVGADLMSFGGFVTREEIEHIVSEGGASGALEEDEQKMIHGVIAFEETRVSEVMAPRIDVYAIDEEGTAEEAVKIFLESGHSRIPVYKEDLDDVIGVLYAKDLLAPLAAGAKNISILNVMRKPLFVPETMKTDEALDIMRKSKKHIAIVVDEYGGMAGLVSLEDLIEEIIGDIQDEYDTEKPEIMKENNGTYLVQAQVNLEDLSEALSYPFCDSFEQVDTLAGMMLEISGNFPSEGQTIEFGPWDLTAVEVQSHRILQVRLKYVEDRAETEE